MPGVPLEREAGTGHLVARVTVERTVLQDRQAPLDQLVPLALRDSLGPPGLRVTEGQPAPQVTWVPRDPQDLTVCPGRPGL